MHMLHSADPARPSSEGPQPDPLVVHEVYQCHASALISLAVTKVGEGDAGDLVHMIFSDLTSGRLQLPHERAKDLFPWLASVLRNRSRTWHRSRSRRIRREHGVAWRKSWAAENTGEQALETKEALSVLAPEIRQAVHLHVLEGWTYGQIGERLSLSPRTIQSRVRSGLRTLRRWYRRHGYTGGSAGLLALLRGEGQAAEQQAIVASAGILPQLTVSALVSLFALALLHHAEHMPSQANLLTQGEGHLVLDQSLSLYADNDRVMDCLERIQLAAQPSFLLIYPDPSDSGQFTGSISFDHYSKPARLRDLLDEVAKQQSWSWRHVDQVHGDNTLVVFSAPTPSKKQTQAGARGSVNAQSMRRYWQRLLQQGEDKVWRLYPSSSIWNLANGRQGPWHGRGRLSYELSVLGSEGGYDELTQLAQAKQPRIAFMALAMLGHLQHEPSRAVMLEKLAEAGSVSKAALHGLSFFPTERERIRRHADKDGPLRQQAMNCLVRIADPVDRARFSTVANNAALPPRLRRAALDGLGSLDCPESLDDLDHLWSSLAIEAQAKDQSYDDISYALAANLVKRDPKCALQILRRCGDLVLFEKSLESMCRLPDQHSMAAIVKICHQRYLDDPSNNPQEALDSMAMLLRGFSQLPQQEDLMTLGEHWLQAEHPSHNDLAVILLCQCLHPRASEILLPYWQNLDEASRERYALFLADSRHPSLRVQVIELLTRSSLPARLRDDLATRLRWSACQYVQDHLLWMLDSKDLMQVLAAVQAMPPGALQDKSLLNRFYDLTKQSKHPWIRAHALQLLVDVKHPEAGTLTRTALTSADGFERRMALWCLVDDRSLPVSTAQLHTMAMQDRDTEVRWRTVALLSTRGNSHADQIKELAYAIAKEPDLETRRHCLGYFGWWCIQNRENRTGAKKQRYQAARAGLRQIIASDPSGQLQRDYTRWANEVSGWVLNSPIIPEGEAPGHAADG